PGLPVGNRDRMRVSPLDQSLQLAKSMEAVIDCIRGSCRPDGSRTSRPMDDASDFLSVSTNDSNPPDDTHAPHGLSEGQTLAGCYGLVRRLAADGGEIWLANDEVLGK